MNLGAQPYQQVLPDPKVRCLGIHEQVRPAMTLGSRSCLEAYGSSRRWAAIKISFDSSHNHGTRIKQGKNHAEALDVYQKAPHPAVAELPPIGDTR